MEAFILALMTAFSNPADKLERCKWDPDKPKWEYNGCADHEGKADKRGKETSEKKGTE